MGLLADNPYIAMGLALGLAWLAGQLVAALFGPLKGIPGVGWLTDAITGSIHQAITSVFGKVAAGASHAVGGSLHWIARQIDRTYGAFKSHASLLLGIAAFLPPLAIAIAGIRAIVNHLSHANTGTAATVKHLERELHGIEHQVKTLERDVSKGIGADVLPRLKHLDRRVHTLEQSIPADIADAEAQAQAATNDLWSWLTGVGSKPVALTFAGAIAVALGSIGLGGLSCNNFKNLLSKYACGLGKLLDDLLGLAIAGIVLEAVCDFLPLLEGAFGAVVGPIVHLLTEVPLGACEVIPSSWAQLDVAYSTLPPPQTLGALPS